MRNSSNGPSLAEADNEMQGLSQNNRHNSLRSSFLGGVTAFWIPSALMGVGIAVDVSIATISRFHNSSQTWRNWTFPVTLTHIFLPAFGYYTWWLLGATAPMLLLPLGIIAAVIVTVFLYETFAEWSGTKAHIRLSPVTDRLFSESSGSYGWVAIMAVSMDALWSGPAKASVAEASSWTGYEVFWSFFVAGVVVAIVAQVSLLIANQLRRLNFSNEKHLAIWCIIGKWLEVSVIGGFGVLSLWMALSPWIGSGNLAISILLAGGSASMLFVWYRTELFANQLTEFERE